MKSFFYPENVVVLGVSEKPTNMGQMIVKNMIHGGFSGQVHAVGPSGGVVLGRPIRKSVKDIIFPLDLAVIMTPAVTIPLLMRECGEAGIRRIVIESAGFSEFSDDRKGLEQELLDVAKEFDIRFVGPNCIGVLNMENGLLSPFVPLKGDPIAGTVSVLSQSGGVALSYMDYLGFEALHSNKVTSMGNKLNVDESDLLEYLVNEDEGTEIICMYLEGFSNATRLMQIARQSRKPIILHKSGIGKSGAAMAASHTAALASDDKVVDAALAQAGIIRVRSTAQMMNYVRIFKLPPMKGRSLAIVSRSGGHGVIAADTAELNGFVLPPFPREELARIREHVRGGIINLQNPMDLGDLFDLSIYEDVAQMILSNPQIDGMILVHTYGEAESEESHHLIKIIKELSEKHGKPVALCLMVDDQERAYLKQNFDFPIFKTPEYAANALKASRKLYMYRQKQIDFIPFEKQIDMDAAQQIVDKAVKKNRNPSQAECFDILKLYGLPVPAYRWVQTKAEAVTAATQIGTPIVLKVDVPAIIHKSDVGGVVLNLKTPEAVGAAFDALENKLLDLMGPADRFAALVMEQVVVDGKEVILGVNQDETFGPTLLFGLGGVFAEFLKDVSLRVVPLNRNEVMGMIQEVKGFKALTGARGQKPVDLDVLADNLLSLAQLARDFTQIKEIDLNPVLVNSEGAWVLDVRFLL